MGFRVVLDSMLRLCRHTFQYCIPALDCKAFTQRQIADGDRVNLALSNPASLAIADWLS